MNLSCSNGHPNAEGAKFCVQCGVALPPSAIEVSEGPASAPGASVASGLGEASTPRSRRLLWLILGLVALLVVVLAGLGASRILGGGSHTIQGTLSLTGEIGDTEGEWDRCQGTGGYRDIAAGASLKVLGANGEIVGSGQVENLDPELLEEMIAADLEYGIGWGAEGDLSAAVTDAQATLESVADLGIGCVLYFSAVVEDSDYYSIEVAQRGALNYSRADLKENGWWVGLNLGN